MRPTKSQIRGLPEIADTFRWNLELLTTDNFLKPDGPSGTDSMVNLLCQSSSLPSRTMQGQVDIQLRGWHIMRPGPMDEQHTLTLTFLETVENHISNWLANWRDRIWHPNSGIRENLDSIMQDVRLERLNNLDEPIWEYKLEGCYVQEYEAGELTGEGGQALLPNLTLYYDTFKDGPPGYDQDNTRATRRTGAGSSGGGAPATPPDAA